MWAKYDSKSGDEDGPGTIELDDVKKLAADIKAKVDGKEDPVEINEDAVDEAFIAAKKEEDGSVTKNSCQ